MTREQQQTAKAIDFIASEGHNKPPSKIDFAREAYRDIAKFLYDTPVITTREEAKAGGIIIERTRITMAELEDERTAIVRPLNDEVKVINDKYRTPRESLDKMLGELRSKLTDFAKIEEEKRAAEAEVKRLAAEEAERKAREAERVEAEAKENADMGEVGVNVGAAIAQADKAFSEFQKANREVARAERDIPVKIGSQLGGRAMSLRAKETLILDSAEEAIKEIGITEKISAAILSAARDYRKLKGKLPSGVSATIERAI